jgi:hypothetical protein
MVILISVDNISTILRLSIRPNSIKLLSLILLNLIKEILEISFLIGKHILNMLNSMITWHLIGLTSKTMRILK